MVSPVDKDSYDVIFGDQAVAPAGDSITYGATNGFADSSAGDFSSQYLSSRSSSGWSTVGISPPQASNSTLSSSYEGFSTDLSRMVLENGDPPMDGATPGQVNLYLRQADGSFHLLTLNEPPIPLGGLPDLPVFQGASSDFSHIVFASNSSLTPNAPGGDAPYTYEWADGQLTLVCAGCHAGNFNTGTTLDDVSADGSRVFYSSSSGGLYMYDNGASTEIDLSQCTGKPTCATGSGSGQFWAASTDGSDAFFTSSGQLTNDSTAVGSASGVGELYRYNAGTGKLTDLSPDPSSSNGGDVQGVVGASDDGSYVYFVANGALAAGASQGDCNPYTSSGSCNLYEWHAGVTTFVARLEEADAQDWSTPGVTLSQRAQVSADGQHLLFTSTAPPASGYDNAGHSEVYLYDAASGDLTCVSCQPSGAPAGGDAVLSAPAGAGANITATDYTLTNMSPDGNRVFFDTSDALVPQDTNGTEDVYEWEADGTGSCHSTADNGGCLGLISSGRDGSPSYFEDATPSGDDVFFLTRAQLVGQDVDGNYDVYDARVDGGLASQNPPPPPVPCAGDACKGPTSNPPPTPTVATVTFTGPGNVSPASPSPAVKVLSRVVHGARFSVRVKVPGKGTITISGRGVRSVRRSVARAGTYRLAVTLTTQERKAFERRRSLSLTLRVGYAPSGGSASAASFSLTVTHAVRPRQQGRERGGAR